MPIYTESNTNSAYTFHIYFSEIGEASTSALTGTSILPTAAGVAAIHDDSPEKVIKNHFSWPTKPHIMLPYRSIAEQRRRRWRNWIHQRWCWVIIKFTAQRCLRHGHTCYRRKEKWPESQQGNQLIYGYNRIRRILSLISIIFAARLRFHWAIRRYRRSCYRWQ